MITKTFLTDFDEYWLKAAALLLETIVKKFGLEIQGASGIDARFVTQI
jgi:hypothetical protein